METARQEAKRQNKQVEIESLHTENSTTVANPDGKTVGTYVHTAPIRVKKNGAWKAIDTTLVEENGVIRPKVSMADVTLSAGGDTSLATARTGKGEAAIGTPGTLPKPELSGSTATYRSAYGPGVDLLVTATPTGLRQEIVIQQRPSGKLDLRLPVKLPGKIKYGKDSAGRSTLPAVDGGKATALAPALLLDGTAASPDAAPDAGRMSTVPVTVEQSAKGPELRLAPDQGLLADPEVTYPVRLLMDSTPWYGPGMPADTFISTTWKVGSANQNMDSLVAGKTNDGAVWRSYIRFDLSTAPFFGKKIRNADVRPWNYIAHACGAEVGDIAVRRITSDWTMNSLRWDNQPSATTSGQGTKGSGVGRDAYGNPCPNLPAQEVYYSIEDIVRAWAAGSPNYGLQVGALNEGGPLNYREYLSAEWAGIGGRGPVLFVEYEEPEYLDVVRQYPGLHEVPPATYQEDKAWFDSGQVFGEQPPAITLSAEQALADSIASETSVVSKLTEGAYYPEGITDEDLVLGIENPENHDGEDPPGTPPAPNPMPSPRVPNRTLNANPFFETDVAPWTVTGGSLEKSSDRAHESNGVASAKIKTAQGDTEVVVRSEADLPISMDLLHGAAGWFFPVAADVDIKYGIDWLNADGSLVDSSISSQTLTRDTWTQVSVQEFPPDGAAKAQLKITVPGRQPESFMLYADELKFLGPDITPTNPPVEQTISLPVQTDVWLDNKGLVGLDGPALWAGAYGNTDPKAIERTYLKFDAASLTGKTITDAKLELRNDFSYGCGDSGSGIKAQRVTTAWSAGVLTWANQPSATDSGEAIAKDPSGCAGTPPTNVTWTWPVTGMVQAWASGQGNHGVLLRGVNESTSGPQYDRGYQSSRTSELPPHPPVLKVTYTDGTAPTPTPTPTPTPGPDTTAPTVINVSPANEATNVPVNAQAKVTFSEPVTDAQVTLTALESAEEVTGSVAMSSGNTVLTFTPSAPLNEIYYGGAVSGAKDAAGNTMAAPYTWSFTATAPTPTPTPTCTYPTWSAGKFYSQGARVTWRGHSWEAIPSWPSGAEPGSSGDWRDLGVCSGTPSATSTQGQSEPPPTTATRDLKPFIGEMWTRPFTTKNGTIFTSTTTPHLMAKISDPLGRPLGTEFEVEHDPKVPSQGKGLIWSGTVMDVFPRSAGSIQVPAGKLTDGWKVRWRARAVIGEAAGTWPEWQTLKIDVSASPQKSNDKSNAQTATVSPRMGVSSATEIKRILPGNRAGTSRMDYAECADKTKSSNLEKHTEYLKNRFDYCRRIPWRATQYRATINVGEVVGVTYYRITTSQNSRELIIRHHVSIVYSEGTLKDAPVRVDSLVKDPDSPNNTTACAAVFPDGGEGMSGYHRVSEWQQKASVDWHITDGISSTRKDGVDKTGSCALTPATWIKMPALFGADKISSGTAPPRTVRCDTSPLIRWYKDGGCIVMRGVAALTMAEADIVFNPETGFRSEFSEVYHHISQALDFPDNTKPGRRTYYDLNPADKIIPGNWGNFLSRAKYRTTPAENRGAVEVACATEFTRSQREGLQCDEFPFASTEQGASRANPRNNYSVQPVDPTHNNAHGLALGSWYQNNRIIRSDKFWIKRLD
ncbi:DNRLRE domain-containing protein [Streptosporangium roseum]|uniref:DNRLRE domain-containing protein n=1 Tax=Streptosporangium roseum TaxID=2001 RepID=UPI003324D890